MDYAWYDFVGNVGVALIIGAYLLLQLGRLRSDSAAWSVVNLLGAGLVLVSLIYDFNLSAFIIEAFWVVISIVGLVRLSLKRRQPSSAEPNASKFAQ